MAVKMQKDFGSALQTIFVESQGHEMGDVQRLALKKGWFGSSAMWTTERPMSTGAGGIPNFVLLSSDGEVVMKGNPVTMHGEIEAYLAGEKKRRSKAPEGYPKELVAAWKALGKGEFATAVAEADGVASNDGADQEVQSMAQKLREHALAMADAKVARLERAMAQGVFARTEKALAKLANRVKGLGAADKVAALQAELGSDDLAAELKAEKALAKIERKLFADGGEKRLLKALQRFSGKHGGTLAAERASGYLSVLQAAGD